MGYLKVKLCGLKQDQGIRQMCPHNSVVCIRESCVIYQNHMLECLKGNGRFDLFGVWNVIPRKARDPIDLWLHKVLILKPAAMERAGIPLRPEYQFFYAETGPGCLGTNRVGEIEGHLVYGGGACVFIRSDFYGLPNELANKRFEEVMSMIVYDTERRLRFLKNQKQTNKQ